MFAQCSKCGNTEVAWEASDGEIYCPGCWHWSPDYVDPYAVYITPSRFEKEGFWPQSRRIALERLTELPQSVRVNLPDLRYSGFETVDINDKKVPQRVRECARQGHTIAVRIIGGEGWVPLDPTSAYLAWGELILERHGSTGRFISYLHLYTGRESSFNLSISEWIERLAKYKKLSAVWSWPTSQRLLQIDDAGPLVERVRGYEPRNFRFVKIESDKQSRVTRWLAEIASTYKLELDEFRHQPVDQQMPVQVVAPLISCQAEGGDYRTQVLDLTQVEVTQALSEWISQLCHHFDLNFDTILAEAKRLYRLAK